MNVDLFAVIGRLHVENALLREENAILLEQIQRMNGKEETPPDADHAS